MPEPHIAAEKVARYSSRVELELLTQGRSIPLSEIGNRSVTLSAPAAVPTGFAEMVLYVDGKAERWNIEVLSHPSDALDLPIRIVR
jgi:hypothetical protein